MKPEPAIEKINSLPLDLQREVEDFIDFLKSKIDRSKKNKRIAGLAKGKVKMLDDFDEPLDDFKAYM
ncbi:DUF2281 domain-containing protein [bacterium]|nr:DUF2281 domain-containing protein [bacterium]